MSTVTQSEVIQKEESKYHLLMHTYGIYKDGTDEPSNGDADMENRLVDKMVEREGGTN